RSPGRAAAAALGLRPALHRRSWFALGAFVPLCVSPDNKLIILTLLILWCRRPRLHCVETTGQDSNSIKLKGALQAERSNLCFLQRWLRRLRLFAMPGSSPATLFRVLSHNP